MGRRPAASAAVCRTSAMFSDMGKIKIKLVKSPIDKSKRQKDTLRALGFRKVNQTVEHEATPQIQGMVRTVQHLVQVEQA